MAGLGKVMMFKEIIWWLCMFQASELVCNNLDAYHQHMKEVRDYLEEQLSVRSRRYILCLLLLKNCCQLRKNLVMMFILMEDFLVWNESLTHVMFHWLVNNYKVCVLVQQISLTFNPAGWKVLNNLQHSMASTGAACHSKSAKWVLKNFTYNYKTA